MARAALIFPHQLFAAHPAVVGVRQVVLVEDSLYFRQYPFHRQKLVLHRASMKAYAARLQAAQLKIRYLDSATVPDMASLIAELQRLGIQAVQYVDPCDDWLDRRLDAALREAQIGVEQLPDPDFLTPRTWITEFTRAKQRLSFTEFYVAQRKRLKVLLTSDGKPVGGKWSFDPENRQKLPRDLRLPRRPHAAVTSYHREALSYVAREFPQALGQAEPCWLPIDHAAAADWLDEFVAERLTNFGAYEDAMTQRHDTLFHSVLTPMLNIGLLSPQQIVDAVLKKAQQQTQKRGAEVPINSLEGFLRQVIGWREYMRLVYLVQGRRQRTTNFLDHQRRLPNSFYQGTTGIAPVDHVIRQVLRTGYCHHIERLMILGNFMLLNEFAPNAVYRWFMEMFVDAYDWVMVPNVYGMSQYADGGQMTTKPYISGSSYVLKMSDFPKGPWCAIWDALYWRFIDRHADFLQHNPRMTVIVKMKQKLGAKLTQHLATAAKYLGE